MMEQDYTDITGATFSDMRVLVESASALFENHCTSLSKLATDAGLSEAKFALNDMGGPLCSLHEHIRHLQSAHMQQVVQSLEKRQLQKTTFELR